MNRSLLVMGAAMALGPLACLSSSSQPPAGQGVDAGLGTPDGGASDGPTNGDAGDGGVVIDCPKPAIGPDGGRTVHQGGVSGNEIWTAADSPHVVTSGLTINGTLTIEPCAEVLVSAGKTIAVTSTGKLVAEGRADKPIHIGAENAAQPFSRIQASGGGTMRFAYATIDGGGDPLNSVADVTGTLYAQGVDQNQPTQETLFVDHVRIVGSKSNGIDLIDGAGFAAGSRDLTVTGSAQFPVAMWARGLSALPTGTYTGNANDEILLDGGGGSHAVHEDTTMRDRGVPYRVGNSLSGAGAVLLVERQAPSTPGLATLTIDAGVKIRMKKGATFVVQRFTNNAPAQGALVVNGTAANPVVFTSAEPNPAPGDWNGIWFGLIPAPNDKIDYARVEYAGATTQTGSDACNVPPNPDAAIRIFGVPSNGFVTNTTIANSATNGIDRGWRNDAKPDFMATNTFVGVALCKQTYPRDTNGACPATPPCP